VFSRTRQKRQRKSTLTRNRAEAASACKMGIMPKNNAAAQQPDTAISTKKGEQQ
jgi:hypothetical protein